MSSITVRRILFDEVVVLGGPAIGYVLKHATVGTFVFVFLPCMEHRLGETHTIDRDYLKAQTRARDGKESVAESSPIMQF